jgi:hypothetical protein
MDRKFKKTKNDMNHDGKSDRWEHFNAGKLAKIELDRNFSCKVAMTQKIN